MLSWCHPSPQEGTRELQQPGTPLYTDVAIETVQAWALWLTEVARRIMPHFARREAQHWVGASLRGLLSPVERTNDWQVAETVGDTTPDGIQPLLGRARWDAADVRPALGVSGVAQRGEPHAVVVLDETGLLKQGPHAAGVARP